MTNILKDGNQPWKRQKALNEILNRHYQRKYDEEYFENKRAKNTWYCGRKLFFKENVTTESKKLRYANFCKNPLCPECAWRKSLKNKAILNEVIAMALSRNKGSRLVFVTLTMENCIADAENLKEALKVLNGAFKKFVDYMRKTRGKVFIGGFKKIEITYNEETNTFHPHIHFLMNVSEKYFQTGETFYLDHEKLVKLWTKWLKQEKPASVRLTAVPERELAESIKEMAKYVVKANEYLTDDDELTDKLCDIYEEALHRKRMTDYIGEWRDIHSEVIADKDEEDLINIDDDHEQIDADVIRLYQWGQKVAPDDYVLTNEYTLEEGEAEIEAIIETMISFGVRL